MSVLDVTVVGALQHRGEAMPSLGAVKRRCALGLYANVVPF